MVRSKPGGQTQKPFSARVVESKDNVFDTAIDTKESVVNFTKGKGFRPDTASEEEKKREQREEKLTRGRDRYKRDVNYIRGVEEREQVEEETAREIFKDKPVQYGIYKTYDVGRDFFQTAARTAKTFGTGVVDKGYRQEASKEGFFDPRQNPAYVKQVEEGKQSSNPLIKGATYIADTNVEFTGGLSTSAVPLSGGTISYSTENVKNRPARVLGQAAGELLLWRGAGAGASKIIGSTGKLYRAGQATTNPLARAGLKTAELGSRGTGKVLASKPVRLASEGYTGEAVDIGQAYFGQSQEIDKALISGNIKEAGLRLAAGYAFEKAGDRAVSSGFRAGLPKTAKGTPDVEKFISESGDDPKIARLFQIQKQKPLSVEEQLKIAAKTGDNKELFRSAGDKESFADKLDRFTAIDFRSPDTRIDPRVLQGTQPVRGGEWNLKGATVRGDVGTRAVDPFRTGTVKGVKTERVEKTDRQERQERQEKLERLERAERLEKQTKTKVFDSFALPIGPQSPDYSMGVGKRTKSKTRTAQIADLAKATKYKGKWI